MAALYSDLAQVGYAPAVSDALDQLYDREFFSKYGRGNEAYSGACTVIAEEIYSRFAPTTVVDWGCGAGLHAAALTNCGASVIGIDGVLVDEDLRATGVDIRLADITAPVTAGIAPDVYDLSLCIDVMEHLEERHSAVALDNIVRGAKLLIMSCAPPGQGGHHHVNEQPRRYWWQRMSDIGWTYDRKATGAMEQSFLARRDQVPLSWMYHNLAIYRPR